MYMYMSVLKVNTCLKPLYFYGLSHTYWYIKYGTAHCVLTAGQNLGKFLEDLELVLNFFVLILVVHTCTLSLNHPGDASLA